MAKPTLRVTETPRRRNYDAMARLDDDEYEYDDDDYDAFAGRREFDELSSDFQRQLSFDDAEANSVK